MPTVLIRERIQLKNITPPLSLGGEFAKCHFESGNYEDFQLSAKYVL